MKREALRHPKMLDLAGRLRIPREHAIGIVSALVDWVHDMAPQGDVGKWPNGAIAVAAGWPGDPDEFINALIDSGWLDPHPRHRLLVHDYPDHAERFVKSKLARARQWFCSAYYANGRVWDAPSGILPPVEESLPILTAPPVEPDIGDPTGPTVVATVPCDQTKPNQTKPNHPQTPEKCAPISSAENPSRDPDPEGLAGGWDYVWTVDSEARVNLELQSCGYKRYRDLVAECRGSGKLPRDIIDACQTYKANQTKFSSPGSLAEFLRKGVWPANDVIPAAGSSGSGSDTKSTERDERYAMGLIREGRKRGLDEQQIGSVLKHHGLERYL